MYHEETSERNRSEKDEKIYLIDRPGGLHLRMRRRNIIFRPGGRKQLDIVPGGDASLSGYTATKLPDDPVLLWTFKSDVRTVSSPIVYDGVTYWCDRRGNIRGVGPDGGQVFEYDLNTAVEATPMIHDSVLYIGRIDGYMTALSLQTKDTLWTFETWGQISASPNIVRFEGKEAVVFGSYDNLLYCVNAQTGKEINSFESGYYLNGAVALWNDYVLFGGV